MPLQFIAQAYAAPTGGQVVAGTANIAQTGNITDIHQSSQNAAINWQDFSIKATETVNFHQPNHEAVTLNRVLGNEKSVIDGMMNANGKVFIQNPNGTLIGKNAQINVGGLVATTAKISDDDFMRGDYRFKHGTAGDITSLGQITVPKGGVVALIAPIVKNQGTITAHEANVLLASADSFSITLPDNANFAYTLDKGTLQGLVDNGGAILADGGRVVLTTLGIDTVKKSIIKHTGVIEANSVQNNNGVIELLGDLDNSKLVLAGTLKAEGQGTDNGGFVETSGAKLDIKDTAHVSTRSENGKTGTWRIDPKDFTVAPTGGDITGQQVSQNLQNNNVQLKSKSGAKDGKGDVIINDEISWNKNTLTLTADNDIHINKTLNGTGTAKLALEYGQGTDDGKVEVVKDGKKEKQDNNYYLDKDTPLKNRKVQINLPAGKNLSLKKGNRSTVEAFDVIHEMPAITKNGHGEWESKFTTDKVALGKDIDVSHTKNHEGFAGWRLPGYDASVHGLGHTIDGLWLRSQDKNSRYTGLFLGGLGLFRNIGVINVDIKSQVDYAKVGGLVGFDGYIYDSYATGKVSSSGELASVGGLAGAGSRIYNSYAMSDVSSGGSQANAGGLMGGEGIGEIHNSYAVGSVSSTGRGAHVGGLVGLGGVVQNSYAISDVSSSGESSYVGGLFGQSGYGSSNNYASGTIFSSGQLSYVGGLTGFGGDIKNSYANNQISATGTHGFVGGVVGYYAGVIRDGNAFFNKTLNPSIEAVGVFDSSVDQSKIKNLIGKTEAELKQKATFKDWDFDEIWEINDGSDYPRLRGLAGQNTTPPAPAPTPAPAPAPTPTPPSSGGTTPTPPASGSNPKPPTGTTPAPTPTPPTSGSNPKPPTGTTPTPPAGTTPKPPTSGSNPKPPTGTTPTPPAGTTPPTSGSNPKPPTAGTTPAPTPIPPTSGITPPASGGSGSTITPPTTGATPTPPASGSNPKPPATGTTPTPKPPFKKPQKNVRLIDRLSNLPPHVREVYLSYHNQKINKQATENVLNKNLQIKEKAKSINLNTNKHAWGSLFGAGDNLQNFKEGAVVLENKSNISAENLLKDVLSYRNMQYEIDELVDNYTKNISYKIEMPAGTTKIDIKDYIRSAIKYNLTVEYQKKTDKDYQYFNGYSYLVSDKASKDRILYNQDLVANQKLPKKEISHLGTLSDVLADQWRNLWHSAEAGYAISKWIIPGFKDVVHDGMVKPIGGFVKSIAEMMDTGFKIRDRKLKNETEMIEASSSVSELIASTVDFMKAYAMGETILSDEFLLDRATSFTALSKKLEKAKIGTDIAKIASNLYTLREIERSHKAIGVIPDRMLSQGDKEILLEQFAQERIKTSVDIIGLAAGVALQSFGGSEIAEEMQGLKSDVETVIRLFKDVDKQSLGYKMRDLKNDYDQNQPYLVELNNTKAATMREILIGVGKTVN